jgi:6-pyruvoyltetrahydropterin/6-carboxytetrahydropterin synthase
MSRWIVHARTTFEATHHLPSYKGRPEPAHGHRWQVAVRVSVQALDHEHLALDFETLRQALERALAELDGTDLNEHPEAGTPSPTAENLALLTLRRLGPEVRAMGGTLCGISVWEGPENRVDLELDGAGEPA